MNMRTRDTDVIVPGSFRFASSVRAMAQEEERRKLTFRISSAITRNLR